MAIPIQETILNRKSTRSFTNKQVSRNDLKEILSAAIRAPSPKNDQPWIFCVTQGKEKERAAMIFKQALTELFRENTERGIFRKDIRNAFQSAEAMQSASFVVFVYLDSKKCMSHDDGVDWDLHVLDAECTHIQAIGAAIENMLLCAEGMGIDSLWIGDIFYAYHPLTEYLKIGGCLMAAVAFGYGMKTEEKTPRKEFNEKVRFAGGIANDDSE